MNECLWCDRDCPRCGWPIEAGWEHVTQPQPEGANITICNLRRAVRPLVNTLTGFFEHTHMGLAMTNNTDHATPPTTWDVDAVDVGDDTYYRIDPADPTPSGILVWHWCTAPAPGPRWMAAGVINHTLISTDPLHLEPSLLWPCCGKHGYIREDRWTTA